MFDRKWWMTLASGCLAMLLLAQLPWPGGNAEERPAAPVFFAPQRVDKLTDERVVDAFVRLSLEPRLSRVEWDGGKLSVDLLYAGESDSGGRDGGGTGSGLRADARQVWSDVAELLRLAFGSLDNVRELAIRASAQAASDAPGGTGAPQRRDAARTLFAATAQAADWRTRDLAALRAPQDGSLPAWSGALRIVWTDAGERWRRNFAKS